MDRGCDLGAHVSAGIMARSKVEYVCTECGGRQLRWGGQCPDCGAWNTLQESVSQPATGRQNPRFQGYAGAAETKVVSLHQVEASEATRTPTGMGELDRVLGGGLVAGSVVLVGGDPGIGKSTILLQTLCNIATRFPALYVTGEESQQQVAMRARRLGLPEDKLKVMTET